MCIAGRRNGRVESKTGSAREWHGYIHARARAHTEKFIPENRGCVSTSMAAGRSMHSPPPELTDAGRRGGQPLHARCHRNALSLKHRLIITDARPFSLSPSSAAIFTPPLGYPVGEPEAAATTHSPFLTAFSSLPPLPSLLSRSLSLPRAPYAFPAAGTLSTFLVLSYLLAGSGRVRDDGDGGDARGERKLDDAAGPFVLRATFSRSNYHRTASCMTSWVYPKLRPRPEYDSHTHTHTLLDKKTRTIFLF